MNVIKKILFVLLAIIAILLITALFVKKEYGVKREVLINKPNQEVFAYIKMLKNQDNYSVWANMDPSMKKEHRGMDGTVGFVSAWDSEQKNVGKGEQEIIRIVEGERIDFELRFLEPFESTDAAYIATEADGENQTKVIWGFDGKMNYPMNLMLLCMDMEGMLGKDLRQGLDNLKRVLESQ